MAISAFSRALCLMLSLCLSACATMKPVADWHPAPDGAGASTLRAGQTLRVHTRAGERVDVVFERDDGDVLVGRATRDASMVRVPSAELIRVERKHISAGKSGALVAVAVLALLIFGLSNAAFFPAP